MPDFTNVLPLLNEAAAALGHNELVQSNDITLFETTSAIEIGEPRMDTGVYTAEEAAFPTFDVNRVLLPQELIWVMDTMLSLEMRFYQGYALGQTILSCSYVHNLDELDASVSDPKQPLEPTMLVLRAFLRGLLKTCDIVMEELLKGHVHDNEDFVADKGGVSLLEDVEIDTVLDDLSEAHQLLMSWDDSSANDWRIPLLTRLRIRTELLCSVCLFAIEPPLLEQVEQHTQAVKYASRHVRSASVEHAKTPGVFNPYLGNHLDSLAPPRPSLEPLTLDEALDILEYILSGLDSAVELAGHREWEIIQDHFLVQTRDQQISPYIRSLHQSVFLNQHPANNQEGPRALAFSFLEGHLDRADSWLYQTKTLDSDLRYRTLRLHEQVGWRLIDYIGCLGKNRSRQYRKLGRQVEFWVELAEKARKLDSASETTQSSSEVATNALQSISGFDACLRLETLLIGFQLELFSPMELPAIYWYLSKVAKQAGKRRFGGQTSADFADAYHYLASASCYMLALSKGPPQPTRQLRAAFERRLKWANFGAENVMPHWQAFASHCEELAHADKSELEDRAKRDCGSVEAAVESSSVPSAAAILAICRDYRSRLAASQTFMPLHSPVSSLEEVLQTTLKVPA